MATVNPEHYDQQLAAKAQWVKQQFASLQNGSDIDIQVFASAPKHYRMRAEFRLWHTDDDLFYAMFPEGKKYQPIKIEGYVAGSVRINELMPLLLEEFKAQQCLRDKLFQVDFLTSQTGEALVSLLYHRQLDDNWRQQAKLLAHQLDIKIIGRARKQKCIIADISAAGDSIMETLKVDGRNYHYQQVENAFTQTNAGVNEKMLTWARQQSLSSLRWRDTDRHDLLELYCGNGNFTVPLASCYNRVLATEISKPSVASAQFNLQHNGITNVEIARLSSEEMTQALGKVRAFRRLQDIDLDGYKFGTVLVDPPRAGLDAATLGLVQQFDRIIYMSCNPQTLFANRQALQASHQVTAAALFDQFPYTPHIEIGVVLQRNK